MSLSNKLNINSLNFKGKRVLVRVDYNVPLDSDLKVTDTRRIEATFPTIKTLHDGGAKSIVLISHLGRPDGRIQQKMSLKHVLPDLMNVLNPLGIKNVKFIQNFDCDEYKEAVSNPENGSVYLFENLRFYVEETGKGVSENGQKISASEVEIKGFRQKLSKLGDLFVFDAFACAHRAHSSVVGIMLDQCAAGHLMNKELNYFSKALETPKKPFLSILGGAKVSDKIQLIENLLDKVDEMIIGGGMAYTFLKVLKNMKIGDSLYDEKGAAIVQNIMEKAKNKDVKIHLPVDFVIADKFDKNANTDIKTVEEGIPTTWMGLDCGPKTRELFSNVIKNAKTVVWNGPLGVFEFDKFAEGTKSAMITVADSTKKHDDYTSIIGGGDTASAAEKFGVANKVSHVSTGGGASLELLEGKLLPGVQFITNL